MRIQDSLAGVEFGTEVEEGEMVQDALILMRVTRMSDGRTSFLSSLTKGTDDIVAAGLLSAARATEALGWSPVDDEEDSE